MTIYQIHLLLLLSRCSRVQLCVTPNTASPPGSLIPGLLQARTPEWVAISFSNAWKWKVKEKPLSRVQLLVTPWTVAYQVPPSMGVQNSLREGFSPPLLQIKKKNRGLERVCSLFGNSAEGQRKNQMQKFPFFKASAFPLTVRLTSFILMWVTFFISTAKHSSKRCITTKNLHQLIKNIPQKSCIFSKHLFYFYNGNCWY